MKTILKVATIKVFDKDFEEWETHSNVTAVIEQADTVIFLYTDGMWSMLSKMRFDINQPVWKKYTATLEEVNNIAHEFNKGDKEK